MQQKCIQVRSDSTILRINKKYGLFFMILVNITSAKAHLSSLLKQLEENNEEIIIERAGKPIAKILKYTTAGEFSRLGIFKNKISVSDDFDQWPDDIAVKLGIKD